MKRLSLTAQDALCSFSVNARDAAAHVIGASHAAFYMEGQADETAILHQLRKFKAALLILRAEANKVDAIIDELEGRKPVVPVDEQRAA